LIAIVWNEPPHVDYYKSLIIPCPTSGTARLYTHRMRFALSKRTTSSYFRHMFRFLISSCLLVALHYSVAAAQPFIFTPQGIMVGEVDETSAILQSRLGISPMLVDRDVPGAKGVGYFEYADNPKFRNSRKTDWLAASPGSDFILKSKIAGLKPSTRYHYRLVFGPDWRNPQRSKVGLFTTLQGKMGTKPVSFVVVTGMNYNSFHQGIPKKGKRSGARAYTGEDKHLGFPALATMLRLKPDFFVGTGDNVYYDSHDDREATDAKEMRRMWHEQFTQPRFVDLFRQVATYWEKDDHDHRFNDCDLEGTRPPLSDLGIEIFREQVPVVDPNEPTSKTYRTFRMNKHLQIWLVEGRDYRSPNKMDDGPAKTLWGAEQIAWLKRTLLASDATYKLLISPTPMVGPDDAYKRDNHTNHKGFRTEGRAFFKWIKDQGLDQRGFAVLCGDRHWQYHSVDPMGIEEFSCGALVDANSRLGRAPGDKKSTDPDAQITQRYTQSEASGGFLRVSVDEEAVARFDFFDENGRRLYRDTKRPKALRAKRIKTAVGATSSLSPIDAWLSAGSLGLRDPNPSVLILGGVDGTDRSRRAVKSVMKELRSSKHEQEFSISYVPDANPDGEPVGTFPPAGKAYNDPKTARAHYLWRWIGMQAPDLVVDVRSGKSSSIDVPAGDHAILTALRKEIAGAGTGTGGLAAALSGGKVADIATIPAITLTLGNSDGVAQIGTLLDALSGIEIDPSPARLVLQARESRSPLQIAKQLSKHYGRQLGSVAYIPALALVGRLRIGELADDATQLADVQRIVGPYLTGAKPSFGKRASGSGLSGHLIFSELARLTGDQRYTKLVLAAANRGFGADGEPLESMPYHNEMSDAVFMGCPILAEAGHLTGNNKYFEQCLRHLRFMREHCLRADGLYRHSPLDQASWGRGNGFPALGLAWTLSSTPDTYVGKAEILAAYQAHVEALLSYQDPTGMWHQVVDQPQSYREFTSTCMITFAMIRGIRNGWLKGGQFLPAIDRAWPAIARRISETDGHLVDVCTGTGKQKDLRAYYDRTAILGRDDRGGAMGLMVATELALFRAE
jgi:alkaline phosphatase D